MDGLAQSTAQTSGNAAVAMPMDAENRQRIDSAKQSFKSREKVGDHLSKFLNRLADEMEDLDREKRLTLFRQQIKAHQYMDGNFYGYVDLNCEWQQKAKGSDEVWYSDNQLYPYLRTALMELSRTQTEILVNAQPGASDEMIAAAKFAKARYDANRDRTFNARLRQTSNIYALLNGIVFWYTFFQFEGGRKERVPKLLKRDVETKTQKLCAMCAKPVVDNVVEITGKPVDPKCLNCGSEIFRDIDTSDEPDTIIGYDDIPNGQNQWTVPNPVGIIVSMQASCIEETPFLKWKQLILRSVLQEKFKGLDLPSTGTSTELRYISNQQKATPAADNTIVGGETTNNTDQTGRELELLEFQQIWLDYPLYCDIQFDEDIPLGRGKTLKAGQKLGELYPDGIYYARCGDLVVDLWNEDKNRKWSSSPYSLRAGSMYGSGSHTALSDQEIINDITTLKMANAWSNGVPMEFVDKNVITELSSDPTVPTEFDGTQLPPGRDVIGGAYERAPAVSLSAEIYGIVDKSESSIQNKIGAMSGSGAGGLQDSQKWGDTATAISIKRDLAVGRFSPDLELMADQLDREQAYQFLLNEQEFFTPKQWEEVKGEYDDVALKTFIDADVRRDFIITVSPGSYMPKSDAQMQAKLNAYLQVFPLLAQSNNPELLAYTAETFGIPEHLGGWNSDRAHAKKVIKRFEALAEMFVEQYGDLPTNDLSPVPDPSGAVNEDGSPVMVPSPTLQVAQRINDYSKMPVDVFLDNHPALQDAYRDWRTTDEGQNASNALLAAVALRVNLHQEGVAKQGQLLTRTQIAVQQPLKEEAEADQAKQLAAQGASEAAARDDAETQLQATGLKTLLDHADKDDQRASDERIAAIKAAPQKIEEPAYMTPNSQ
jgi:hypothetical protein